jgi:hypothetical protein
MLHVGAVVGPAHDMRAIAIRDMLKRLATSGPVAMLALGVLLTFAWVGALGWVVYFLVK